ncbi:unnamed protein product [Periconia digitata]|uniref:Uncharacterized protein n=1 Tax=Periconia digitata TaxID=1303443 RepID=A0A9W4UUY4_9PLEO|nr:unnamed protein product [Periconia digitata]
MEKVGKTYFDPLARSKSQIVALLETLPVGSAHPFSPENILLCRTKNGIEEIDISSYEEDNFLNQVDLGEMAQVLLQRMSGFKYELGVFDEFRVAQVPNPTFRVPIVSDQIAILAVSLRKPTYYDLCFADSSYNASCWNSMSTLRGIRHSGDHTHGEDFLAYITLDKTKLTNKEICVFISGYRNTQITEFNGTHPAVLVADHVDKVLYTIPVPLDRATVNDSTICCPMVFKRDEDSLICSMLPTATTDRNKMCNGSTFESEAITQAINRADFDIPAPSQDTDAGVTTDGSSTSKDVQDSKQVDLFSAGENAVLISSTGELPSFVDVEAHMTNLIHFDTGIEFDSTTTTKTPKTESTKTVLPCIFGSRMEGPLLLALGRMPANVPFATEQEFLNYYQNLKNVVVVVDERMTDNARNLASRYRINALFIVQLLESQEESTDEILQRLNTANINAVTALAGPQSLVLVQIRDKFYFYRGIANREHLNTSKLAFGSDVTSAINSAGMSSIIDPRAQRIVNLDNEIPIIIPSSGKLIQQGDIKQLFEDLSLEQIRALEEDVCAIVPQLQSSLGEKELIKLSESLVSILSSKLSNAVAPLRNAYVKLITEEGFGGSAGAKLQSQKGRMLGELRKSTKELQKALKPVISSFENMISAQTSSKRTHDLQRLARKAAINSNVEATKSMTFDTVAGFLEDYAGDMGVLLLNIEESAYLKVLRDLNNIATIDARDSCNLDRRLIHLEGLDAGIVLPQSQNHHHGPLSSQKGSDQPILAMPNLNQHSVSMLALVCWDEFVNLESPYTVRWVEKCNEKHIAALRILMRDTLSSATACREYNFSPGMPEIGNLLSRLLMAAMFKLAGLRTSAPTLVEKAEDTVTRLMRGLFGNLLTTAGSGVKPMSMVWQLFGLYPQIDLPDDAAEWVWYETVVSLYPYTGWPLQQFNKNLEKLLDKAILRVITKNERKDKIKDDRMSKMIECCRLRNIQLDRSRSIITVIKRMLTDGYGHADAASIASRLLAEIPHQLERQSQSYTRMIKYLKHLAALGSRIGTEDLIFASVYNKRSAAYSELKTKISEAAASENWPEMKQACQQLMKQHDSVASLWKVNPRSLRFQNIEVIRTYSETEMIEDNLKNTKAFQKVIHDAEKTRVPWQVGKKGQFGNEIEPLDEAFVQEMLTGERPATPPGSKSAATQELWESKEVVNRTLSEQFSDFDSTIQKSFITQMQKKNMSAEDVCNIIKIPVSTMRAFVKSLNADFVWGELAGNFKAVVLALLKNRSNRESGGATRILLGITNKKNEKKAIKG